MPDHDAVHEGLWEELRRLRDRIHAMNQDLTALMMGQKEIEKLREHSEDHGRKLAAIEVNIQHLIEVDRNRFGKTVSVVTVVVALVTTLVQLVFQSFK